MIRWLNYITDATPCQLLSRHLIRLFKSILLRVPVKVLQGKLNRSKIEVLTERLPDHQEGK